MDLVRRFVLLVTDFMGNRDSKTYRDACSGVVNVQNIQNGVLMYLSYLGDRHCSDVTVDK